MPDQLSPESADAIHKAKNAAQAVEMAREAQVQEALSKFADQNNKQLLSILKEVFGESDAENPKEMKILVRRIPILCTNIENMHKAIEEMRANQSWVIKLIIGAVIAAVMAVVLK